MRETQRSREVIGVSVAPEVKAWVRTEAAKKKWTPSFFCHQVLLETMEREEGRCAKASDKATEAAK